MSTTGPRTAIKVPRESARSFRPPLEYVLALVLGLVPWLLYRQFLSGDNLFYLADQAQLQYPRFHLLCDALQRDGVFPLWQSLLYAGSPFHANPEIPTLYPPIVCLAMFCSPLRTMNLTVLIHLSVGIVGAYVLLLALWRGRGGGTSGVGGAFVGAICYGLNFFTRFDHFNFIVYGAAHALVPWILLAAEGILRGRNPKRSAGLLAVLVSLQVFTGGLYVEVFTGLALVLWFVVLGLFADPESRRRVIRFAGPAAVITALIVSAKVLPFLDWLPTTNRGAGEIDTSSPLVWKQALARFLRNTGWGLTAVLGLTAVVAARRRVVVLSLLVSIAGVLFLLGPPYELLRAVGPPFDLIRTGHLRAWTLSNIFLPICVAFGLETLIGRVPALRKRPTMATGALLALGALAIPVLTVDPGRFRTLFYRASSLAEMQGELSRWSHSNGIEGQEGRIAFPANPGIGLHNEQLFTALLGLETVAGFLGYVWPVALEAHVLGSGRTLSVDIRKRRLGVLSAETLVRERGEPDARNGPLPERYLFDVRKHGTYIDTNPDARPRAFAPSYVIGVFGDESREATYALLDSKAFPLDRASIVRFRADEVPSTRELEALDLVVAVGPVEVGGFPASSVLNDTPRIDVATPLGTDRKRLRALADELVVSVASPLPELVFTRTSVNTTRLDMDPADSGRFIVVSETWAEYGGWVARCGEREVPIRSADGIASAVFIEDGEGVLEASYEPRSVRIGFALSAVGLVLAMFMITRRRA